MNWDQYSDAQISKKLKVLRRSTLIAMKGSKELGRLVAATSQKDIKELMDKALLATD